jgi:hypothetical protein
LPAIRASSGLYDAHAEEITRTWDGEDEAYLTHAVSLMAQHEVSLTPNLVAYREIADQIRNIGETLARKDRALTPPIARVYATPPFNGYVNDFGGDDIRERAIAHFTRTAKAMDGLALEAHVAGVMILAGSDVGNPTMFAGQALYREMELLKDAGLDGYDTLAAATLNVAKLFGEENERGSVAAGKVADLVLFRVNPVDHRGLMRSDVAAVIKDGVLFDPERIAAETTRLSGAYEERAARYHEMAMTNHTRNGEEE